MRKIYFFVSDDRIMLKLLNYKKPNRNLYNKFKASALIGKNKIQVLYDQYRMLKKIKGSMLMRNILVLVVLFVFFVIFNFLHFLYYLYYLCTICIIIICICIVLIFDRIMLKYHKLLKYKKQNHNLYSNFKVSNLIGKNRI